MSRVACALLALLAASATAQTRTIVGQHDDAPLPSAILDRLETAGQSGWVTVAVGIGTNPADMSGFDFSALAADGHEVIVRLNAGFFPTGTIPVPSQYSDFATRCANAVANSTGAAKWLIGNETNLAVEWPQSGGGLQYISPASYAECFRECFDAIKAVDANAEVLVQSIAPWGGPYGPGNLGGFAHVGQPDTWIDYLHRVLDEIDALGVTPDGLTLHSGSRGYDPATVFNDTSRITAGPLNLAFGWEVHREWIMFGIPPEMWELPIYVTESNGLYWWKGGGPESGSDPAYQAGWLQGLYGAANAWNQSTRRSGMPPILCLNLYRWGPFDDWGIQALASGNPSISAQFLADMGAVVASQFTAPHQGLPMAVAIPGGENVAVGAVAAADTQLNASNAASRAVDGVIARSGRARMAPWITGCASIWARSSPSRAFACTMRRRVARALPSTRVFCGWNLLRVPRDRGGWRGLATRSTRMATAAATSQ